MHSAEGPRLWFESLYSELRLPFWLGTAILSVGPFLALLFLSYYLAGTWSDVFTSRVIFFVPIVVVVSVYMLYASRYIRRKMQNLAEYCDTLRVDGSKTSLSGLTSFRAILVTFLVLTAVAQPLYAQTSTPASYSLLQKIAVSVPFIYWELIITTMIWTFGYGMFGIFLMGRSPLKLKSFAEDRTLGLRPFGITSLQLTGTYLLLLAVIFTPQVFFGFLSLDIQAFALSLVVFGILLFFLPLLRYRRMLLRAKHERMKWLAPQYADFVRRIEQIGTKGIDASLASELAVIEKLQTDIRQIHDWPFDVGVVARLAAIVVSILTVILSSFIQNALHI